MNIFLENLVSEGAVGYDHVCGFDWHLVYGQMKTKEV